MSFTAFIDKKEYLNFKGGIFDLDNTLYSYPPCNSFAKDALFTEAGKVLKLPIEKIEAAFNQARHEIHHRLEGTAAMHSRFLYIQRMLELLAGKTLIELTSDLHTIFWNHYFKKMDLEPWVKPLLAAMRESGIKTAVLTDLTAELQFEKMEALGLSSLVDWMITSEEAGREKPAPETIQLVLEKLALQPEEVFFVGDHPVKDRLGETIGIKTFIIDPSAE